MTIKQSPLRRRATLALAAFGFAFAFGATAAPRDLIVCAGGVYCYDLQRECEQEHGAGAYWCELQWRSCVLDACPQ